MLLLFIMINNFDLTSATSHTSTIQEINGTFNILEIFYPNAPPKIEYVLFTGEENQMVYKLDINQDSESMEQLVGMEVKIRGFHYNVNADPPLFNRNIPESNIMSLIDSDMRITVFEISPTTETESASNQPDNLIVPQGSKRQDIVTTPAFVHADTVTARAVVQPETVTAPPSMTAAVLLTHFESKHFL